MSRQEDLVGAQLGAAGRWSRMEQSVWSSGGHPFISEWLPRGIVRTDVASTGPPLW